MIKIVKSKSQLRKPSVKVESVEEGEKIAAQLLDIINKNKSSGMVCLAAPQIGIQKSVFVVNVKEPKIFINPEVSPTEDTKLRIIYREQCASFPNELCWTLRHKNVKVKSDNFANEVLFGPDSDLVGDKKSWSKNEYWNDAGVMECVYIQQMANLLNGKFLTDREFAYTITPERNHRQKFGRNQQVVIQKGTEEKYIKFKHAQEYLDQGWNIV
jgi:hypothetical protein